MQKMWKTVIQRQQEKMLSLWVWRERENEKVLVEYEKPQQEKTIMISVISREVLGRNHSEPSATFEQLLDRNIFKTT